MEEIVFEGKTADSTAGFVDMSAACVGISGVRAAARWSSCSMAAAALVPALTSDTGYVLLQIDATRPRIAATCLAGAQEGRARAGDRRHAGVAQRRGSTTGCGAT